MGTLSRRISQRLGPTYNPSGRWPVSAEGLQHAVEIVGNGHFVVEKILQPKEIPPLGHGDERQQVPQANADVRFRYEIAVVFFAGVEDFESRGHGGSSGAVAHRLSTGIGLVLITKSSEAADDGG